MNNEKITKSTQEQAVASWIDYLYQSRIVSIIKALANQDFNLERSIAELQKIKDFISNPAHILGSPLSKHGEIAENFQVYVSNAIKMLTGEAPEYTFENVGRTAPEDYLKNGVPVQSKFYHEYAKTFRAVCNHLTTYSDFIKNGGTYDIPKNQYESITDILFRGDNARSSLSRSDETLYKNIREWEKLNNIKFEEVIKPSIVNYDDVQINRSYDTLEAEQQSILHQDKEIRKEIYQNNSSTVKEAAKIAGVSASLEGGTALIFGIIKKIKAGKKLTDFTADDWKEVGIDTAIGTTKGGIRGTVICYLVNQKNVSAPLANAIMTASFGITAEAIKVRQGKITVNGFYDNSVAISLDVSIGTVSSVVGSAVIPIPILGTIIGNTVGMWIYNIAKDVLSQAEFKSIKQKNMELELLQQNLDMEYKQYLEKIEKRINDYNEILSYALDEDAIVAYQSAEKAAYHLGLTDRVKELSVEERDNYFLN